MLLSACSRATIFSGGASRADEQGEASFGAGCDSILQHTRAANQVIPELRNFTWTEFAALGVVLPPPGVCATGITYLAEKDSVPHGCNWIPLTEKVYFAAATENFAVACANCLSLAKEVCSSGGRLPPDQRQELFARLDSALTGAAYMVLSHESVVVHQVIPEIESEFGRSGEYVRQRYGDRFRSRCDEYLDLLHRLQYHLEMARELAVKLSGEQDAVYR